MFDLNQAQLGVYYAEQQNTNADCNYWMHTRYHLPSEVDAGKLKHAIEATLAAHPHMLDRVGTNAEGTPIFLQPQDKGYQEAPSLCFTEQTNDCLDIRIHHILADGVSLDVILEDIGRAYAGENIEPEKMSAQEMNIKSPCTSGEAPYENETTLLKDVYEEQTEGAAIYDRMLDVKSGNATFFMAAFALTLSRFSGEETVAYSTFFHGRHGEEEKRTVNMMVRTLAIQQDLSSITTAQELLDQTRAATLAARESEASGMGKISFIYQGSITDFKLRLGDVELITDDLWAHAPGLDMNCWLEQLNGQYRLRIWYPTHLFSKELMAQFADSYNHIALQLAEGRNLADTETCTAEQTAQLDAFNTNGNKDGFDAWKDETIISLFRKTAKQYPDNLAAVYGDKRYTYAELDAETDRLAAEYSKQHKPGSVIPLEIDRDERIFLLPLAVLKAGCIYQPVDPTYPDERKAFMVKDGQENTPAPGTFILLYTSGSTGTPKGVMLSQQNILAYTYHYQRFCHFTPQTRVAAYASFGFDANMMDLYPTLLSGGSLFIIPEDIRLDMIELGRFFEVNGITHAFMTTQVAQQFAQTYDKIGNLQVLSLGGEKMASMPLPSGYMMNNIYGPTECSVAITMTLVEKNEPNIPIGRPTDTTSIYVVDKHMHRLPVGAPGELLAAGPQVGLGYLGQPEKTAQAFSQITIDNRQTNVYRTGDVVRWREDGQIEFVGRKDGQVKIRGFRIELKEVEAVIREFAGIRDVTVQAFDDPNGGKFLCAYIVSDTETDIAALNQFIASQKPPYMVPAVTMQIEAIPLNVNQKVDKKKLPKPEAKADNQPSQQTSAPLNKLEQQIKEVVVQVIHTEEFGITDPLMYFGLTSISSIKLATLIYKQFGVQLPSRELMKGWTLQDIENAIIDEVLSPHAAETPETPVEAGQTQQSAPLSFTQQGVYAECMANAESVMYNMPFAYSLPAGITAEQLSAALEKVVAAHPYLKSHFVSSDKGEVIQKPIADFELNIPIREMKDAEYADYRTQFVRPFILQRGPLFRFEIIQSTSLHLLLDIHHLVADGASINLLLHELCDALNGQAPEAEEYDYYQFVRDQHQAPDAEEYFDNLLGGTEEVSRLLPDLYEDNLPRTTGRVSYPLNLAAQAYNPASLCLAATMLTIGRYLAEDDVSIATISNGRSNLRIAETCGMFVNTLPIVGNVQKDKTLKDFIEQIAKVYDDAIAHENYPFAKIASRYDFKPQISYAYQVGVMDELMVDVNGAKAEITAEEPLMLDVPKLPVSVFINGTIEHCTIDIDYDESLYSAEMMRHLAKAIALVTEQLGNMSETRQLSDISLTDKTDWELLDTYNVPQLYDAWDHSATIVSQFRKQVLRHPDKTAAVYKDKRYTYAQLDAETDRMAALIMAKTAGHRNKGAESVVSILIDRSEFVFLLPLAALKAGCAYEPLDPSYPSERLNYMVQDAQACLLIAQPELRNLVNEYTGQVLLTDSLDEDVAPVKGEQEAVSPSSLALLLYTSGSTGKPKGVQIEQGNVVAFAAGVPVSCVSDSTGKGFYTEDAVVAAYASFGFDVCMQDTWCTLLNGGTLVVIPDDLRLELKLLAEYMESEGVTQIFMTTQVGVQFSQNYPNVKHMRYVGVGGEKLPAVDASHLSYKLLNGYGPTENTAGVSLFVIEHWEKNIPLGRPIPTILGYVLDKGGHRLPPGACGEYCLVGEQVSRGYLGLPEKTAEVYQNVTDLKFSVAYSDMRLYHTGDVVRYRENGDVEFVGRKDGLVKIRGFRIELKEVEAAIREYTAGGTKSPIKDVTVQAYDYEGGGKYLAAFVVSDEQIDISALTQFIKSQKPPYMVPSIIMQIDSIPLTVNQKVDKKSLPKPQLMAAAYVAPANKVEADFCAIFAEVLGQEKVSAASDFFEIGGSSIIAIKVVIAAEQKGYTIVYNDIFSYPTAQNMASYLGAGQDVQEEPQKAAEEEPAEAPANTASCYGEGTTEIAPDGYDYASINSLLRKNTLENFLKGERQEIGDVLLVGATGYLGIHVLKDLIDHYDNRIYCFIRGKGGVTAMARLQYQLYYFFEHPYKELFGTRIFLVEGDATDEAFVNSIDVPVQTVINCAACVKHFSKGNEIELVNVKSVRNLVGWCISHNAKLVHVSTGSVMGSRVGNMPPKGLLFDEHVLYWGQYIDNNQYIHSKFMAERLIYEAILQHGLNAKVMRVGNLAPRDTDGEFQMNFKTNNFMATLAAFAALGKVPYSMMDEPTEFSPIDYVARSIMLLATTPKECVCFMSSNQHRPLMGDVIDAMNMGIIPVELADFQAEVQKALSDPDKVEKMRPLMAYGSTDNRIEMLGPNDLNALYTSQILHRLGFSWPTISTDYIQRFIKVISGFNFFD